MIGEHFERWWEHPSQFVQEVFGVTPDAWQHDALEAFPHCPRIAMKACKGPGKTAVLAWIGFNFLMTRPHPKIGCTSINEQNLKSGLWSEFARWYAKSPLLQRDFVFTKSTIFHRNHPETWKIEKRTWAKDADQTQIGNSLAGLHQPYVMWLLDESGSYPPAILPACEAIFAGCIEAHIVQAGNPTSLSGPLYMACVLAADQWKVIEITGDPDSPKRSPRIPVEHARAQIKQYGRDNPWVLVNIFGQFPPSSPNALIGPDEVREAMRRSYQAHQIGNAAKVLGLDVARFGDDSSVLAPRHGIQMLPLLKWRNMDSTAGAAHVSRYWGEWNADGCMIDMSGGYGTGWYDQLKTMGRAPLAVEFGGGAVLKERYANKRAEMAFQFVQWIKDGGALPDDGNLLAQLTETTYSFARGGDKFILEPKEHVKERLGTSPDEMDACMCTFAFPIVRPSARDSFGSQGRFESEYDALKY